MKGLLTSCIVALLMLGPGGAQAQEDARDLVVKAMDQWRGITSHSFMTLVIHRPDWERSMSLESWTEGTEHSLVRVTDPPKDAGNGTLLKEENMWTYSPRINRVIKVPSSMMSQSWMGSDLSNKDVAKSADIIDQYEHTLLETRQEGDHQVYVIESIPHEEAAVVWGREVLSIRDDYIMLEEQFWDQDDVLVKTFTAREIQELGGRTVATIMRMETVDSPGQWTEIRVQEAEFDLQLPANLFTLSNLRNPRQ